MLALFACLTCILAATFASGCGGQPAVDHGGSLVGQEGQIVFTRFTRFAPPDVESEICVVKADGTGEQRFTDSPGLDAFPAWSSHGQRIAFSSDNDRTWEIYAMDAHGACHTLHSGDTPTYRGPRTC